MRAFAVIPAAGASLIAMALATPASAQDQAAPAAATPPVIAGGASNEVESGSPDIIVEARRRDESVQDVPLVVNTVTTQQITQLNLRDFRDISTVVPGLTLTQNSNGIGSTSSVRGVNFDVTASGANGTIEYYLNDTPVTTGAIFNALFDIGQIEVLRGPQGTLRGRASPSGSITISHKKPDMYNIGGYALGTLTDIGGRNVNAAVGVPIIDGKLAIRVAGLIERNANTRVRSINNPSVDPYAHTKAGRIFLRAEPTDFIEAEAVYQRIEQSQRSFDQAASFSLYQPGAVASPILIEPGDRRGIKVTPNTNDSTFDIFTWKASTRFVGQQLIYVGQHTRQQINAFQPQDEANAYPALALGQFTSNDSRFDNHEIRLQNEERVAGLFDYVAGYFHAKLRSPSYIITERLAGALAAPTKIPSATLRGNHSKEESFFGNLSLHLGDATELSGGARHIRIQQVASIGVVSVPGGIVLPPAVATDVKGQVMSGTVTNLAFGAVDRQFEKTIFAASAKHRLSEDFLVYANFGTSFRPGNNVVRSAVNQRPSALETGFLILPSETSKSYEIGIKSQFLHDTLTVNVAAFRQDFKNYPFRSASGIPYLQYDTLATAVPGRVALFNFVAPVPVRVKGFEVETNWRPSRRFYVTANVAYALGRIRNGQVACLDLNGDGVPDAGATPSAAALFATVGANNLSTCPVNFRSATASPWNATVQSEYTRPLNPSADGFLRGLFTFSGSSLNDPANSYDNYDAYGRLNLYAGVRDPDGAWEVSLYGKNLFRNNTVLSTSNGPAFTSVGATVVNSPYISVGTFSSPGIVAPREFGITGRFAFGSR